MWAFPLAASAVALAFAILLARQFLLRRRSYQALWALAMAMFAAASLAMVLGVPRNWSTGDFRVFWLFGAVLNVPYLAGGELHLLLPQGAGRTAPVLLLSFGSAFAVSRGVLAHVAPAQLPR